MKEEENKPLEKMSIEDLRKKQTILLMQALAKHKKMKEEERKKREQEKKGWRPNYSLINLLE